MPVFKIDESYDGLRLDEAVSKHAGKSRAVGNDAVKSGRVSFNGLVIEKPSRTVRFNDEISYELPEEKPTNLIAENIPLSIVYEDDDIIVINKPAGLVVHPGNGHGSGTLANALLYHGGIKAGEEFRPGIVHRIDKDTSGLLAVAKNELAFQGLKAQLEDHSMHREYLGLALGVIDEDEAKIDAPIGRDVNRPTRFAISEKGKEAVTYFHVEKRYLTHTLLSLRLETGRTHQIRVHLEYIGHPIEGDPLYGSGNRKLYDKGQLLHARKLMLKHPRTGKDMVFEAPVPDYFLELLKALEA